MPTTNECPNNMESNLQSTNKGGSSKPTAADSAANTKPHIKNEDDEDDFTKVVMGGSIRGMLLFLFKKISLKAILKRKAFLTIGGTAEGGYDKDFVARKSVSSLSHSRPVVYAETTMMGIVVFGTYDLTLRYLERRKEYNIGETPVVIHAGAGVAAGVARSFFWMAWERAFHQSNWILSHPKFCVRTTMHHAGGYGALFGSYQGIRQFLVHTDPLSIFDRAFSIFDGQDETSDTTDELLHSPRFIPFTYTVISGGLAGQIHHVLNHYTSHWRQFRTHIPRLPRFYPTMSSFGTMALCFAAFEHGPQAMDGLIESINETIQDWEKKSR